MEILDVDEVGTGVREPRREKVVTVIKTGSKACIFLLRRRLSGLN